MSTCVVWLKERKGLYNVGIDLSGWLEQFCPNPLAAGTAWNVTAAQLPPTYDAIPHRQFSVGIDRLGWMSTS